MSAEGKPAKLFTFAHVIDVYPDRALIDLETEDINDGGVLHISRDAAESLWRQLGLYFSQGNGTSTESVVRSLEISLTPGAA